MPPGDDFLAQVCVEWEREAAAAAELGVRTVLLRTGIVLGSEGGALKQMLLPFKLGLGGRMGPGTQKFSWIHVEDLYRCVRFVHARKDISGPVTVASPDVVTNHELMRMVRRAYRARFGIPRVLPSVNVSTWSGRVRT
mgnify:CR=1 FL=1